MQDCSELCFAGEPVKVTDNKTDVFSGVGADEQPGS